MKKRDKIRPTYLTSLKFSNEYSCIDDIIVGFVFLSKCPQPLSYGWVDPSAKVLKRKREKNENGNGKEVSFYDAQHLYQNPQIRSITLFGCYHPFRFDNLSTLFHLSFSTCIC